MRVKSGDKEYYKYLAIYLNTKQGGAFVYHILSQLIEGFTVKNGRIEDVHLDDESPLVIDFE